jgi:hypothetical protein
MRVACREMAEGVSVRLTSASVRLCSQAIDIPQQATAQ